MRNNIMNLWYGNVSPAEQCGVNISEIERIVPLIERNQDLLTQDLNKKQNDLFKKYSDCYDEYASLISAQAFSDGFCLACKLLAEVFTSSE